MVGHKARRVRDDGIFKSHSAARQAPPRRRSAGRAPGRARRARRPRHSPGGLRRRRLRRREIREWRPWNPKQACAGARMSATGRRLWPTFIRGKPVDQAISILGFTQKRAAAIIQEAVESRAGQRRAQRPAARNRLAEGRSFTWRRRACSSSVPGARQGARHRSRLVPVDQQSCPHLHTVGDERIDGGQKIIRSASARGQTAMEPKGTRTAAISTGRCARGPSRSAAFLKTKLRARSVRQVAHRSARQGRAHHHFLGAAGVVSAEGEERRGHQASCAAAGRAQVHGKHRRDSASPDRRADDSPTRSRSSSLEKAQHVPARHCFEAREQNQCALAPSGIKIMSGRPC